MVAQACALHFFAAHFFAYHKMRIFAYQITKKGQKNKHLIKQERL